MTKRATKKRAAAKAPAPMGRHAIFRGKDDGVRVQAIITKEGGEAFDAAREQLKNLVHEITDVRPEKVSDADTVEYLARGGSKSRKYLLEERKAGRI